jgi:hypothetical protein
MASNECSDEKDIEDQRIRIEHAADSILGDERLTAGLDDETGSFLLDWGLALAKIAAADSSGLEDQVATEIMQTRIKAAKRLLRYLNYWLRNSDDWDLLEEEEMLSKIYFMAGHAYGTDLDERMTDETESKALGLEAFLSQAVGFEGNSIEKAKVLRELIEGNGQEIMNG